MVLPARRPAEASATPAPASAACRLQTPPLWRATLAAACASLVGIGLARFAYTPLLPAIIDAHWFSAADATYLGAANLAGYLLGVASAAPLGRRVSARRVLQAMMAATTLAMFACAWPVNVAWFFAWRLVSGIGGGAMMILAAPAVLPHAPAARRGLISGMIFMGVGLGIAASGTLVPLMLRQGLAETWIGIGVLCLVLTIAAWGGWPEPLARGPAEPTQQRQPGRALALRSLTASYALNAVGLVPHMIFLVLFVARGLHQGLGAGARYWVVFGLAAIAGPLLTGKLADRTGYAIALRLAMLLETIAVLMPALDQSAPSLVISTAIMGAFTPGIVPLVLGRIADLAGHHTQAHKIAWAQATTAFATFQALGAYAMSYLLTRSGGEYRLLFALGAGALGLALLIDIMTGLDTKAESPHATARRSHG